MRAQMLPDVQHSKPVLLTVCEFMQGQVRLRLGVAKRGFDAIFRGLHKETGNPVNIRARALAMASLTGDTSGGSHR